MTPETASTTATVHASAHKLFSARRTWAIATNTFRDLVRQKVFYFMLVFALVLIGTSLAMASISFQGQLQTVMDVCLGAMSVFTMLLAVLSTAMLLPKDMEDRTLYTILAKPVARFEYLAGKLIGVTMILFVATLLMVAAFCAVLHYWQGREIENLRLTETAERAAAGIAQLKAGTFTPTLFGGIGIIFLRSIVCATLTLMLSCFATSWLFTVIVALMMILAGHLVPIARSVWQGPLGGAMDVPFHLAILMRLITVFVPDMQLFNVVDDIAVGVSVGGDVFLRVAGLGAGYVAIYLLVGYLFFAWREL
jgi:ABC-type transport system involved in multi-copper enzyme maturation permease subunit